MAYPLNPRKLPVGTLVYNSFTGIHEKGRLIIVLKSPWLKKNDDWTWLGYDFGSKKVCNLNCTSTYWEIIKTVEKNKAGVV